MQEDALAAVIMDGHILAALAMSPLPIAGLPPKAVDRLIRCGLAAPMQRPTPYPAHRSTPVDHLRLVSR